jgi:UDP-glucose 4-epimerase
MPENRVVLVTGVAGYWGSRVAALLVAETDYHVIGLGVDPPAEEVHGLDFIRADVRNPVLVDLLRSEEVDTVCHLAFMPSTRPKEAAFDLNVMGTTKLLAACGEAGVRKVVLKSSTAVYGARPSNPAFLTEDRSLRGSQRYGYTRDMMEVEKFCSGFRHRVPGIMLTILRFASIIGPTVRSPLTRFLREPLAPSLLGFDPMMQIVHEDDVVDALIHAVLHDAPGIFNVAAEDSLPLNKVRGLAGKAPLAILHPVAYWGLTLMGGRAARVIPYLPMHPDYLRFPLIADLTKMHEELGFEPRYTAGDALREFSDLNRMRDSLPESAILAQSEERLRTIIQQRQRAREWRAASASSVEQGGNDE